MKVLIVGNPLLKYDSLPLRILPKLKKVFPKIEFKEIDPSEDLQLEGKNLIIIDSAEGIKDVVLLEDLDKILTNKIFSLHDFDLGITLKLLKKANLIDSVKLICVPRKANEKEVFAGVVKILEEFESK
ncbi:MAG: hypothetical protein QXU92_00310 [Candidatus Diapherotrites archaeon]